jgi:uncharacterized protein
MLKSNLILILTILVTPLQAQRFLHFTKTSGWDHQTRAVSYTMFQGIADELEVVVDDDATGDAFDDTASLAQYSVIVFSNTSGNDILTEAQRGNFEQWVNNGGHVLGIHAASDTYRHSTANGNNTGTWDFYPELLGASVQENPNHVSGTPTFTMQRLGAHPSIYNIPDQWEKAEEYYYWEGGYFAEFNTEVLVVEETVGPNGLVNSYDAPRPMSWYRFLPQSNSRVFYTALGHAPENFTSDTLFRAHVRDALGWLLEGTTGMAPINDARSIGLFPNPATDMIHVNTEATDVGKVIQVIDATGRVALTTTLSGERMSLSVPELTTGKYLVRIEDRIGTIQIVR